jgi:hypothetical protein
MTRLDILGLHCPLLKVTVLGQKGPQVVLGDTHHPTRSVRDQDPGFDPALNRPLAHSQQVRDLLHAEEATKRLSAGNPPRRGLEAARTRRRRGLELPCRSRRLWNRGFAFSHRNLLEPSYLQSDGDGHAAIVPSPRQTMSAAPIIVEVSYDAFDISDFKSERLGG